MNNADAYTPPQAPTPDHEILSVRTISFPRSHVFAAWTHPDLHAKWWGPAGFTNSFYNYDPRPGGEWRFTMHSSEGKSYENHSVFLQVAEGACLVFKHDVAPIFTAVVHFKDDGEGTHIEWHMIFEDEQTCASLREFVGDKNEENFDRLETLLRDTPADSPLLRELVILREFPAAPDVVWRTMMQRTKEWWCPKPWTTPVVDWELRPGGRCRTVMQGPGEEQVVMTGTVLDIVEDKRFVFTDAIKPGWQLSAEPFMVGAFELFPAPGGGTTYRASARHWTQEKSAQHAVMGFRTGWGAVADQLLEVSNDEAGRA